MNTERDNLQPADGKNLDSLNENTEVNIHELNQENNEGTEENLVMEEDYESSDMEGLIEKAQEIQSKYPINTINNVINNIRDLFFQKFEDFDLERKSKYLENGGDELGYQTDLTLKNRFNSVYHDYKARVNSYFKDQELKEQKNLDHRLQIIDELKELYTTPIESIGAFFKKFRNLKSQWHEAGKIPKAKAGDVFRTYFHHLNNTHEFIKLNKELEELDYAHNLEQRRAIIKRAEELVAEPSVQKALNELQYLHKLWKEQAEPVAEEFRESTWQEFKNITQQIHERKSELLEKIKTEQEENLKRKLEIIAELEKINLSDISDHSFWQNNIKKIENLREEFFTTGRTPKEHSNQTWNRFKELLHEINTKKNNFYKQLKKNQQENLKKKNELLEIAKANKDSEDWPTALNLFKKIQNDWKNIGHVPRKYSDKLWNEFRENCNYFFDRYKQRNDKANEEWTENLENKKNILTELVSISQGSKEEILAKINELSIKWNSIGKVPRESMGINREFNQEIKKLMQTFDLNRNEVEEIQLNIKVENYKQDDRKLDDDLRKMKKQMQDLEHEIVQLENNLSFFSNAKSDNPLLKNTLHSIETKKDKLEDLKQTYSKLITLDFSEKDSTPEENKDTE